MSAPSVSCPPEIKELMTVPVTWEKFLGFDGKADPSYAAPVTLYCYKESHGLMQGGLEAIRKADETTADPDWDLFFSGDDVSPESFSLYDRFTVHVAVGDTGFTTQPASINTIVGPNFDNTNPWLICVSL